MHDIRMVRENSAALRDGMRRRGALDQLEPVITRLEGLDRERRLAIQAVEERKAARNAASQEVGRRKKAGEDASELQLQTRALGEEIARLETELQATEALIQQGLYEIPNVTLAAVPEGDDTHNAVVRTWGTPRAVVGVRPHWEVGEEMGLIDLARGAKISGSGFIVYRGAGARLVRAFMNFMLDLHTREHGYEECWVPVVVNRASMTGTGQLPKFEDDMYALGDDQGFLIPTAEGPVTNLHRDEMLDAAQLPRAMCP